MEFILGNITIVMVMLVVLALIGVVATYAKNYHKVAPNQVAVISGRRSGERGYRVVTGGGFFLWPIFERIDYLFLNVMSFNVQVTDVPDANGVLVDVTGVANVKILSDQTNLPLAIERFLGKDMAHIQAVSKENLESNLRAIVGTMTVEQLNQDRNTLQQRVMQEAVQDLGKLGLGVDVLNIQQVTDKKGYIEALGKARTAEVVRDANIGEANAKRDAEIARAKAEQEATNAKAEAEKSMSEVQTKTGLTVAENNAKVQAAQARISIVAQTAAQEEQKKLNVATVAAEKEKVVAETELQQAVATRNRAEVEATTLVMAKGEADALVIKAQGLEQAASKEGEALRIRQVKEAEGRQALATAIQTEGEAQAAAERAKLLAQADGVQAQGLAEAAAIRAKLLAEAEGAEKKAEAFGKLDEAGRFLMILEASPNAIRAFGDAIGTALQGPSQAIGAGLANVEEIRLVDLGGGQKDGASVLSNFANLPTETLFGLIEKAKAAGFGPAIQQLAEKAGVGQTVESPKVD